MSAVRTPRALGRSVGLSAARPAAPLGTAPDSRRPARPRPPWRSPGRGSASSSYSSTPRRGARGGRPGRVGSGNSRELSCRPRPPPGPQSRGWAGVTEGARDAKAGPSPRPPARPPVRPHAVPAGVSPPTLRAPQPACVGGCWRSACGRAVAVSRGPGRTWVELRPPSDPVRSRESALPPRVSFPGRFL